MYLKVSYYSLHYHSQILSTFSPLLYSKLSFTRCQLLESRIPRPYSKHTFLPSLYSELYLSLLALDLYRKTTSTSKQFSTFIKFHITLLSISFFLVCLCHQYTPDTPFPDVTHYQGEGTALPSKHIPILMEFHKTLLLIIFFLLDFTSHTFFSSIYSSTPHQD